MKLKINYIIIFLLIARIGFSYEYGKKEIGNNNINDPDFLKFKGNEMMIITVPEYLSELHEFIRYKESKAMNVEVDTIAALHGIEAIQNVLLQKYNTDGLHFIILVGDIEDIPSPDFRGAPSDPTYALLEGDDLIGDALISRISVKNNTELKNIMNKIILYEKGDFVNKDWISKAIVVGCSDFDGVNHTSGIVSVMRDQSDYFSSVEQILETDTNPHEVLMESLESEGANMIVYNSHGGPDGFYSIEFRNHNIPLLETFGESFSFIHGAACSTGTFQLEEGDCFAEAILKTGTFENPAGAIAMCGFNRSTDPGPAMMAQRIAFKDLYFRDEILTIGELFYYSNLMAMEEFSEYIAELFYKHWHLFGDCSAPLWKSPPQNVSSHIYPFNSEDNSEILFNIYPNPFLNITNIQFELSATVEPSVLIYDINGNLIKTLCQGRKIEPGSHNLIWDARNNNGALVCQGKYFIRFENDNNVQTKKVVYL
ncbi:C25 family cysteine peptidase [Bacteroidota bacterium]